MRRGVGALALAAAAALLAVAPASASSGAQYGIQDDAWLAYGPGTLTQRATTLHNLGVKLVRFTLRWDQVAPTKPADATDPADPAYRWGADGEILDALHARGIAALVTLYGSPRWANGGNPPNWLPTDGLADFATAAAHEFPWVHLWTIWNEPNTRTFSVPVSPSLYVTDLLNPAYDALKKASRLNKVAGGVTSPRKAPSGLAPYAFMVGMAAAHPKLDAYAQNPYPVSPGETPFIASCSSTCDALSLARLSTIRADVTRLFGRSKALWLTEYGVQTNPPDPLLGVPLGTQALYIGQAALHVWEQPGTTMLIQFLYQDEPSVGGWQSGVLTAAGKKKPSYNAFMLPFAEISMHGSTVRLWGQVRPGTGARKYAIQRKSGSRWITVGGTRRTGRTGTFERTLKLSPGTRVRVFAPVGHHVSAQLTLR
jgi:hypothetical protein